MTRWCLALTAALVAAVAPAQDPKAVVEAAVKAHGGADSLRKFHAGVSEFRGEIALAGAKIPFTGKVTHQAPDKFYMVLTAEVGGVKQEVVQVVNGADASQTVNGQPQRLSDALKRELLQSPLMQEVARLTPLLDQPAKYTLAAAPGEVVGGKPTDAVLVAAKDPRAEVRLFFDRESHLLVKTVRPAVTAEERAVTEAAVQSEFADVAGVKVPRKVVVTHDGRPFMTIAVTSAKALDTPDAALFKVAK